MRSSGNPTDLVPIKRVRAQVFTIPTDGPEADGTLAWTSTTLILVEISAGSVIGLGYTYSDASAAYLIGETLGALLIGTNVFDIETCGKNLHRHVRNMGRSGLAATAISAIDCALWDAKAKLLGAPLARLLGMARDKVPVYGSGGFTTYSDRRLQQQLAGWVDDEGCRWVKMKIGTSPEQDPRRVEAARSAIGNAELFVDANGALSVKSALTFAEQFAEQGVTWFEEPVSSDDVKGLQMFRKGAPAAIEVAAGEYGYTADDFLRLLSTGAVDVLQADASRCGGVSGFVKTAVLCEAFHVPFSAHCAPALHRHVACAVPDIRHLEWFHDHVRIESMLFDGAPVASQGAIVPDLSREGCGLALREADAKSYRVADFSVTKGK